MKFIYSGICLQEVPNEISAGITLLGCTRHCEGCHSKQYWDTEVSKTLGEEFTYLNISNIITSKSILDFQNASCICFFGGDWQLDDFMSVITSLRRHFFDKRSKLYRRYKLAWYTGMTFSSSELHEFFDYFDYIKVGHYDKDKGGLISKTTNQRFYSKDFTDNTSLFWR